MTLSNYKPRSLRRKCLVKCFRSAIAANTA